MTLPSSTSRAANSSLCHGVCSRGSWSRTALLHRQVGLSSIARLDLRFFIDRENDGMGGRIDIKPDHIAQLVDELRILA